jgi:hypothetical protein
VKAPATPFKELIAHRALQTGDKSADRRLGTAHVSRRLGHGTGEHDFLKGPELAQIHIDPPMEDGIYTLTL